SGRPVLLYRMGQLGQIRRDVVQLEPEKLIARVVVRMHGSFVDFDKTLRGEVEHPAWHRIKIKHQAVAGFAVATVSFRASQSKQRAYRGQQLFRLDGMDQVRVSAGFQARDAKP